MFNTPPTDAPAQATEGQSENWQERFKGLQREFNKLKTEHEAATARASEAEGSLRDTKAQLLEVTKDHQTEIAQVKGQLTDFEKQVQTLTGEKAALQADLGKFQRTESNREALRTAKASDLLPFVDAGALDVAGLEGDALNQKIEMFRGLLQGWGKEKVMDNLAGSSPSVKPTASIQDTGFTSAEQMFDWLMNPQNEGSPQYATVRSNYLQATKS